MDNSQTTAELTPPLEEVIHADESSERSAFRRNRVNPITVKRLGKVQRGIHTLKGWRKNQKKVLIPSSNSEGLMWCLNIIFAFFKTEKKIDPLFQRSIDMGMSDDDLYTAVSNVFNGWQLIIVLWTTISTPACLTIPDYMLENGSSNGLLIAYEVFAGFSAIFSVMALYVIVGCIISLGVVPKHGIKKFLEGMGAAVRIPYLFFSISLVAYLGLLASCFYSMNGIDLTDPFSNCMIVIEFFGIMTAWYYHHLYQDRVLLNVYRELAIEDFV